MYKTYHGLIVSFPRQEFPWIGIFVGGTRDIDWIIVAEKFISFGERKCLSSQWTTTQIRSTSSNSTFYIKRSCWFGIWWSITIRAANLLNLCACSQDISNNFFLILQSVLRGFARSKPADMLHLTGADIYTDILEYPSLDFVEVFSPWFILDLQVVTMCAHRVADTRDYVALLSSGKLIME